MAEEEGGGLLKRSLTIKGHRTSIALEQQFWDELEKLARLRGKSLPALIADIDQRRAVEAPDASLASSIRVFALGDIIFPVPTGRLTPWPAKRNIPFQQPSVGVLSPSKIRTPVLPIGGLHG